MNLIAPHFFWRFYQLLALPSSGDMTDVIASVKYRLHCSIGSALVYRDGVIDFSLPEPDHFVKFDEITEAIFVSFAEISLGAYLDELKEEMIDEVNRPQVVEKPLPWLQTAGAYTEA
jgi:hypothetical protein